MPSGNWFVFPLRLARALSQVLRGISSRGGRVRAFRSVDNDQPCNTNPWGGRVSYWSRAEGEHIPILPGRPEAKERLKDGGSDCSWLRRLSPADKRHNLTSLGELRRDTGYETMIGEHSDSLPCVACTVHRVQFAFERKIVNRSSLDRAEPMSIIVIIEMSWLWRISSETSSS